MLSRITLHSRAIVRALRTHHSDRVPFFLAGIGREIVLASYLSTPLVNRLALALV